MRHKTLVPTPRTNKKYDAVRLHIDSPDSEGDVYVRIGNTCDGRWVVGADLPGIAWAFLKAWMRSLRRRL